MLLACIAIFLNGEPFNVIDQQLQFRYSTPYCSSFPNPVFFIHEASFLKELSNRFLRENSQLPMLPAGLEIQVKWAQLCTAFQRGPKPSREPSNGAVAAKTEAGDDCMGP